MSRTRLTALLVAVGLGAAGLSPAGAAPQRQVERLDPQRAVHAAVTGLLASPDGRRLDDLRSALTAGLRADTAVSTAEGPRDWAYVSSAGDVDADRRTDVIVERDGRAAVRSGRDGRLLLQREDAYLLPVASAGPVRLLGLRYGFTELDRGFAVDLEVEGLDGRGRTVWSHASSGTVSYLAAGPAFVARIQDLPAMLHSDQLDAEGRPALLIGSLSATQTPAGITSTVQPALLSLADGSTSPLPAVRGAGRGAAWVFGVPAQGGARSCYGTSAPVGPATRLALICDQASVWSQPVRLRDPWVDPAGDFDGDGLSDLVAGTYGFERPRPREVFRGTQVLSFADGSSLGRSALDTLQPLRVDISGDSQPDFLELTFVPELAVQALTLSGEEIWRRPLQVTGDAYDLDYMLGVDLSGDGIGEGLVVAGSEKGPATSLVVDGRTGRTFSVQGVDSLLLPGLRRRGADFAVLDARAGRARATALSGDGGRPILSVTVSGPAGTVSSGGAGAVDVDGNGRRDLVVASRTGEHQVTTAFGPTGRVLWQVREKAPRVLVAEVVFVESDSSSGSCC